MWNNARKNKRKNPLSPNTKQRLWPTKVVPIVKNNQMFTIYWLILWVLATVAVIELEKMLLVVASVLRWQVTQSNAYVVSPVSKSLTSCGQCSRWQSRQYLWKDYLVVTKGLLIPAIMWSITNCIYTGRVAEHLGAIYFN